MKKKRGKFSLMKEYKECWNYIKESKKFIYGVIGVFVVFSLVGFFIPAPAIISESIMEFMQEILAQTEGLSQFQLINFIFFNNLKSSFFGMVLGVFFGVFPLIATLGNGYILGFVSALSVNESGIISLFNLVPHGIFEFPAIFLALGLGLKLGTFMFKKNKYDVLKKNLLQSLKVFLFVIVPLLIIAGVIEGCLIILLN